MIELKRLKLINWHNFENTTFDCARLTYMIGVNAVGKTTILDAIRYCLTTNRNFNALGNKKSGRTLQGSVHAKQRGCLAQCAQGQMRRAPVVVAVGVLRHEGQAVGRPPEHMLVEEVALRSQGQVQSGAIIILGRLHAEVAQVEHERQFQAQMVVRLVVEPGGLKAEARVGLADVQGGLVE